ncbi:MAG TPA: FAD-dependent oxidoreductase [Steroidobacteraceae bacterium]|nr:FAD-dependent oxidoreductase [Steroidobacteraceae bacterium]HRX88385.1 FAD-dependent oxidoreductase [Steroidobacteraceae bacterium]
MPTDPEWDVIVAGGGTAGMPLAIFAAQRGARVLVLERNDKLGGTLHMSSGQLSAAGTRLQAQRAIDDSPQKHFEDAMRISHRRADGAYLRKVIDNAADTLHWLLDNGFEVMPDHPIIYLAHEPYDQPRTYFGPRKALGILEAMLPLYRAQERAGRIRTQLQTTVTAVVQDHNGAVHGLRYTDQQGVGHEATGRNVVLALGGYARHPERFKEWTHGYPLYSWGYEYARGDGHQIGLDAGAVLEHGQKYLCTFAGIRNPQDPTQVNVLTVLTPQLRQPWEIYVSLDGKRFLREDHPSVDARERALLPLPEMSFWAIYDQGIVDAAPTPFFFGLKPEELAAAWNVHPSFKRADSIEALATAAGLNAASVADTIARYNAAVAAGDDPHFGREHLPRKLGSAPYYAVLHHGLSVTGWAGLDTDEELRVLRADHSPIPNLYAVGELLGFGRANGDAFVGGMGLQPALTMGRLMGQRMLKW